MTNIKNEKLISLIKKIYINDDPILQSKFNHYSPFRTYKPKGKYGLNF